ncbi:MAG TPA: hypothetical protein VFQ22_07865 [Longimicrobiales bacterium]|nr:hypothetical protein [Longimicrobiales bacterium]
MPSPATLVLGALAAAVLAAPPAALAQAHPGAVAIDLAPGWRLTGNAQAFPVVTVGAPSAGEPLQRTGWYLTQPALMTHVEGPGERIVLHTTLNFEGLTQPDGELTYGGWGEGFIDVRHPHTLLHELLLSYDAWDLGGGALSLTAGKGFAPFGTSDPMARPGLKYPTNHHLSQILERWLVSAAWIRGGLSVEGGVFSGAEPEGPYDLSNIRGFGDSWSARVALRWGAGTGPLAEWEASVSVARVSEEEHVPLPGDPSDPSDPEETFAVVEGKRLYLNAALRRSAPLGPGHFYGLLEASRSRLGSAQDFFSVLAEGHFQLAGHEPYARLEYARRPEYPRLGTAREEEFFRYEHHLRPTGTTRWLVATLGYGYTLTPTPWSVRPFLEVQYHAVRRDQGRVTPEALYGRRSAWALTFGARIYLGGDPMPMGQYGVLDPMTAMSRQMDAMAGDEPADPAVHPPDHTGH